MTVPPGELRPCGARGELVGKRTLLGELTLRWSSPTRLPAPMVEQEPRLGQTERLPPVVLLAHAQPHATTLKCDAKQPCAEAVDGYPCIREHPDCRWSSCCQDQLAGAGDDT